MTKPHLIKVEKKLLENKEEITKKNQVRNVQNILRSLEIDRRLKNLKK